MAIGTGLMAVGGILKAFSAISAGREADEVSEQNALQLNADAEIRLADARRRAAFIQRRGERLRGTQRASSAARGVIVGSGSSLDHLTETVVNTNLQAADELRRGQIQAQVRRLQAKQQIRSGNVASRAGFIQAGGNILQTGFEIERFKRNA